MPRATKRNAVLLAASVMAWVVERVPHQVVRAPTPPRYCSLCRSG